MVENMAELSAPAHSRPDIWSGLWVFRLHLYLRETNCRNVGKMYLSLEENPPESSIPTLSCFDLSAMYESCGLTQGALYV